MAPARKVYTESMIRKVVQGHFEVEPTNPILHGVGVQCECSWYSTRSDADKAFEDHFIDQLHKLWHETVGNKKKESVTVG